MKNYSGAELIQSYFVTENFDKYEKLILWNIIETMNIVAEGKDLDKSCNVKKELFGGMITMQISEFMDSMKCETCGEINKLTGALRNLTNKKLTIDDKTIPLITLPELNKTDDLIVFKLEEEVFEALQNIAKDLQKYSSFMN